MVREDDPPEDQNEEEDDDNEVGYCRPPRHTRFKKGQSGNPKGRPKGITVERAKSLALKEAYRMVRIKEGESTIKVPAIQAIIRQQLALAAKGSGPAQRAVIEMVQSIERDGARQTAEQKAAEAKEKRSPIEMARRIAFALELGRRAQAKADAEAAAKKADKAKRANKK
jgi:hypothetical protein